MQELWYRRLELCLFLFLSIMLQSQRCSSSTLSMKRRITFHGLVRCMSMSTDSGERERTKDDLLLNNGARGVEVNLPNHRFWTQRLVSIPTLPQKNNGFIPFLTESVLNISSERFIDLGMTLVLSKDYVQLMPIHQGKVQPQHIISVRTSPDVEEILVCGFRPRATHVPGGVDQERPMNLERLNALKVALRNLNSVTEEDLLGEELAGTPPARIFRSFVCPRPSAEDIATADTEEYIQVHKPLLGPLERAATRTAMQIEQAMRQVRADRAQYLRNTDNPMSFSESISLSVSTVSKTLNPVVIVLDNLRSAHNVGSIFRTADTAGAVGLISLGITPHPPNPKLRKTAFASLETVPNKHYDDSLQAISDLKKAGYLIVVMETTAKSQIYSEFKYPERVALVVGNEITGVDPRIMENADVIVEIPTFGTKNSLNVASALPIVLFEVLRQWRA